MKKNSNIITTQLIRNHPFIFTGLSLLIFATIILVITAVNINKKPGPVDSTPEGIGDYEAEQNSKDYNSRYPIISILPIVYAEYDDEYDYTEYRIDGGSFSDCDRDFCLKITDVTGGNMDHAKAKIRNAGFNPDDFQILYEYRPIAPLE